MIRKIFLAVFLLWLSAFSAGAQWLPSVGGNWASICCNGAAYTGVVATRGWVPNAFVNGSTAQYWQARHYHIARDHITSAAIVVANWYAVGGFAEAAGSASATSVTASFEYPAGTFVQITFSASATGSIPSGGQLVSDFMAVNIPAGAGFWVRMWENNSGGLVYQTINPFATGLGDGSRYSATSLPDLTLGGTISNSSGAFVADEAVIATTQRPSACLYGDSRMIGLNDTFDASGDVGEVARSLGPYMAYINFGNQSDTAAAFISGHANRIALAAYCSHAVIQYGVNDLYVGGATAVTVASSRQTILSYLTGKRVFETTIPTETTSTDGWATTVNQTVTNSTYDTQRKAFNTSVKAGSAGMTGHFDIEPVVDSNSIWFAPGYTTDGIHETQAANLDIAASGAINYQLFYTGTGPNNCGSASGARTTSGGNTIIAFSVSDTLLCTNSVASAHVLVVGGGGGGGASGGGGGGGGGVCSTSQANCGLTSTITIPSGNTTVTVGAGGAGGTTAPYQGSNGGNSVFGSFATATGGGGGGSNSGSSYYNGLSGGSGGGGSPAGSSTTTGGAGTSGQGNAGGGNASFEGTPYPSGGGGGAGAIGGSAASNTLSGSGGNGVSNSITGTATYYGGGGGGSYYATGGTITSGGLGGGGAGTNVSGTATAGTANTGGGGGATINGGGAAAAGGSGVVIISAPTGTI